MNKSSILYTFILLAAITGCDKKAAQSGVEDIVNQTSDSTGAKGIDQGATGPQGEQGPKGADGISCVAEEVVEGIKISCGDKASVVLPKGIKGDKGVGCHAEAVSGGVNIICGDLPAVFVSNGAQGDKGDKGDTGAQGDKGDTGAQGDKGDKGDTGAQGDKGNTGAQGDKGNTGAQGDKGDKGDTGAQGDKGNTGAQGDKGDTGAQGDKGDKGDTGAQGDKGDKGDTGAQGDKGDKGDTGAQGDKGASCSAVAKNDGIEITCGKDVVVIKYTRLLNGTFENSAHTRVMINENRFSKTFVTDKGYFSSYGFLTEASDSLLFESKVFECKQGDKKFSMSASSYADYVNKTRRTMIDELKAQISQKQATQSENNRTLCSLKEKLYGLKWDLKKAQAAYQDLVAKKATWDLKKSQVDAQAKVVADLELAVLTLNAEISAAQGKIDGQNVELKKVLVQISDKNDEIEKKNAAIKKQDDAITEQNLLIISVAKLDQSASIQAQIDDLDLKIAELEKEYAAEPTIALSVQIRLQKIVKEVLSSLLQGIIASFDAIQKEMGEALAKLEKEKVVLKSDLETLKSQAVELAKSQETIEGNIAVSTKVKEGLDNDMLTLQADQNEQLKVKAKLDSELADLPHPSSSDISDADKKIEGLNKDIEDQDKAIGEQNAKIEALAADIRKDYQEKCRLENLKDISVEDVFAQFTISGTELKLDGDVYKRVLDAVTAEMISCRDMVSFVLAPVKLELPNTL